MTQPNQSELREQLAAIEHERWSDWQKWVHEQCSATADGRLIIPKKLVDRWNYQMNTPYGDLSKREKLSDQLQVDRYWCLVMDYITANYTPNSEVAEREQSLWAITYDFLHGVDRGLCDEWERVIAERAKLKEVK